MVAAVVKEQSGGGGGALVTQAVKFQRTVEYIREVAAIHGPFDGIGGFSEGAATVHTLLRMQAAGVDVGLGGVRFCIAFSPWISPMATSEADPPSTASQTTATPCDCSAGDDLWPQGRLHPLRLPLLITIGSKDLAIFQEAKPMFASEFEQARAINPSPRFPFSRLAYHPRCCLLYAHAGELK